jgi:hypothetical protein
MRVFLTGGGFNQGHSRRRFAALRRCFAPRRLIAGAVQVDISSHGERRGKHDPQRGPRSTSPHGAAHRLKPRISPFRWRIASRYLRGGAHLSVARGRVRHPRRDPCSPTAPGTSCGIVDPGVRYGTMQPRRNFDARMIAPRCQHASAWSGADFGLHRFHLTRGYFPVSCARRAMVFAIVCACSLCPTI